MDDWVYRRDLIAPQQLKELSQRSDARGFLQYGSYAAAVVASGTLLSLGWGTLWCAPLFLIHGALLNFLYAGQHELIHRTLFRTRWLNDAGRFITGLVSLYPSGFDQKRHFQHHRYTKDVNRDADLPNRVPLKFKDYVIRMLGFKYWVARITNFFQQVSGHVPEDYFTPEQKQEIVQEARVYLAVYVGVALVSVWTGSDAAIWYWLAPMLLTKGFHQVQNVSEHSGLPNVSDIRMSTRTVDTNPLMRWLVWNMCYHADHHLFPGVPSCNLSRLHAIVRPQLKAIAPGYARLHLGLLRDTWRARPHGI